MKIRTSFVSNSSSTSFCCFGVVLGRDQQNRCKKIEVTKNDEWGYTDVVLKSDLGLDYCEGLGDIYDKDLSIGLQPSRMKDNETLLEFKQRVFKKLEKLNLDIKWEDMRWITDGGYHG